jgi:hypothetical protein
MLSSCPPFGWRGACARSHLASVSAASLPQTSAALASPATSSAVGLRVDGAGRGVDAVDTSSSPTARATTLITCEMSSAAPPARASTPPITSAPSWRDPLLGSSGQLLDRNIRKTASALYQLEAQAKRCTFTPDYHVEVDGHHYSVPFGLLRKALLAWKVAASYAIDM